MRVVVKPAGLVIVIASFGILGYLALRVNNGPKQSGTPAPVAVVPSSPTVKPSDAAPNPGSPAASPSIGAAPTPTASVPPDMWKTAKRILEPDIASKNWAMLLAPGTARADHKVVPSSVSGHPYARRITVTAVGKNPWEVQIAHPLDVAFKKGARIKLTYWGRSKNSGKIAAVVEQAKEPWTKLSFREASLTPEWKQYTEEWEQTEDTPSGWAHIDFQVGRQPGDVEFTGITLDAL